MKTSLFKLITLGAICASITLVPAFASAQDHHNRGHEKIIRQAQREIDRLQEAKERARRHHDWKKVKMCDEGIAKEREVIRRAEHMDHRHG